MIQHRMWQKMLVVPSQVCLKYGASTNKMSKLLKKNIPTKMSSCHEKQRLKNRKPTARKIEKHSYRNMTHSKSLSCKKLKEMRFIQKKIQLLIPKKKKIRLQRAKEKWSWTVDDRMKAIFQFVNSHYDHEQTPISLVSRLWSHQSPRLIATLRY